jgi:hypothetical protein
MCFSRNPMFSIFFLVKCKIPISQIYSTICLQHLGHGKSWIYVKGQTVPGTLAPLNHYRSNLRLWKHRASLAVEPVPEAVKEARRSRIMSDERPGTPWDQGFSLGLSWIRLL